MGGIDKSDTSVARRRRSTDDDSLDRTAGRELGSDRRRDVRRRFLGHAARAPKRKLTWLWVLIGTLSLIAVLVIAGVVLFVRNAAGPIDATNRVLRKVKAREYPAAQQASCKLDRTLDPREYASAFQATVEERGRITGFDVNYSKVDGGRADVRYDIEWARAKPSRYKGIALKEDGKWRACLLKVE